MKQNNGANAKVVVCKFLELQGKGSNIPSSQFGRHMVYAKRLLELYELEDILYALELYKTKMYSLGYLTEDNMKRAVYKREADKLKHMTVTSVKECSNAEERAERNRNKLERLSNQSFFGKRNTFDLLKDS